MVASIHLILPLLRAVARGELPPRVLTQIGVQHLLDLCPHCKAQLAAWEIEQQQIAPGGSADLEREARGRAAERRRARQDLRRLLQLPPAQRLEKVRRARRHLRGRALTSLLVEESKRRRPEDAAEAYHLAELARTVADHSRQEPGLFDLIALATAHMANARRAAGNLREAEKHFDLVHDLVREQGVVDPLALAEIDHLEGSLRNDQRLFPLGEELLERAAMLYRLTGNKVGVGRVLLTLGTLYFYQGRLDRALATTRSALRRFRRRSEPWLYLCGRADLALYLTEADRFEEAAALVAEDADLYGQFTDPWTQVHRAWLRGRIDAGLGNPEAAEAAYLAARNVLIQQGIGFDAAMVSLDLALLYLKQGRARELKRLAEEIVPIFAAQDLHREAAAAFALFQDALWQEALTVQMVRELVEYLRAARTDPSLRFREPS